MRNRVVEPDWELDEDLPPPRRTRQSAVGRRPADWIGMVVVAAGAVAITVNAVMLQKGPHPAPFGFARPAVSTETTAAVALPMPVARPPSLGVVVPAPDAAAKRPRSPALADLQRELQRRGFFDDAPNGQMGPKTVMAIRDAELALGLPETGEPSDALLGALRRGEFRADLKQVQKPPPPAPAGDPRVRQAQHALNKLGYGPVRADGRPGAETRAAVQQFERDRALPATGEVSDRVLRELASVIGSPLD